MRQVLARYRLPRRLDRILPDVDVEGEKLRHLLDDAPGEPTTPDTTIRAAA